MKKYKVIKIIIRKTKRANLLKIYLNHGLDNLQKQYTIDLLRKNYKKNKKF